MIEWRDLKWEHKGSSRWAEVDIDLGDTKVAISRAVGNGAQTLYMGRVDIGHVIIHTRIPYRGWMRVYEGHVVGAMAWFYHLQQSTPRGNDEQTPCPDGQHRSA